MGLRFRKSFALFPGVQLKIGKRSAIVWVGGKGFGITSGAAGSRASIGIPGSRHSYTTEIGGPVTSGSGQAPQRLSAMGVALIVVAIVAVAFIGGCRQGRAAAS